MSNDITMNQVSKEALKVPTSQHSTVNKTENRQDSAVNEGKALPPDDQRTEVSGAELQQAVAQLNEYVQQSQRDLFFSVDDSSGRTVVRVVNSETEEVIRQIPNEDVLRISRNIQDQLSDSFSLVFETSA